MYNILRRLLFRMDAEDAHHLAIKSARFAQAAGPFLAEPFFSYQNPLLNQEVLGLAFRNPVGLAAGFDKNGDLAAFWHALGFGFAEVGSVTAKPSAGNPKPRAFRLPLDRALINRMGLNNVGAEAVATSLSTSQRDRKIPLGINIAKTHDPQILGDDALEDFRRSFSILAPLADYIALNISCPNTKEGKTYEEPRALDGLLQIIMRQRREMQLDVPVLVKLSPTASRRPGSDGVNELVDVSVAHKISGFIATNTAPDRDGLSTSRQELERIGTGGLSGQPIQLRATELVRYLYRRTNSALPVIGVGGIMSPTSAYARIQAGASLIQLYTGLVYEGPGLVRRINKSLVKFLERDGYSSISDAVGVHA